MTQERKLMMFIAASADGFIAGENDDLGFLSMVEVPGEDYGYNAFIKEVDSVILGRKTYDKVLSMGIGFTHSDKDTWIITRTPKPAEGKVKFYNGGLTDLVADLKSKPGKNIFVDGGSEIIHQLMIADLFDEYIISVIPVFLGKGIPLFQSGRPSVNLVLKESSIFPSGLVQLHYIRKA